ncbi:MAG: sulfatase [Myxococcota bacterium]
MDVLRPLAASLLLLVGCGENAPAGADSPNILFVFADDLGYGDLGVYGAAAIDTPNLDALAAGGVRMTQLYSGNAVCTPSRAVLLTGRSGGRQRLEGTVGGVYFPFTTGGMGQEQVTLAEVLREEGYRTALVGKWHLGHEPIHLPTRQGFDRFFGLPYSNDMLPLPVMEGETELQEDLPEEEQAELQERYTERIEAVMEEAHREGRPFFVYYATHAPHVPLVPSADFDGTSARCAEAGAERACGTYADVVAEMDSSVGRLVDKLRELGIEDETLVVFTSDNGPWLDKGMDAGSPGPFREGKGSTFEGGFRVPAIASWPGTLREGAVEAAPAVMYDWLPTLAAVAGADPPGDRAIDGQDLLPLLRGEGPRDPTGEPFELLYYRLDNETPGAYRRGRWKYKAPATGGEAPYNDYDHGELLFDLEADPGEQNDLSATHPERVTELREAMEARHAELTSDPLR